VKTRAYQLTAKALEAVREVTMRQRAASTQLSPSSKDANGGVLAVLPGLKSGTIQTIKDANGNYQFQRIALTHQQSLHQVHFKRQNGSIEEQQLLLSLPKGSDMTQLEVSVFAP